mmetsp:Transcript_34634/g.78289  ORF Transcript_34634/g.78289 Transcript_34634/m.78289 type:complete len:217 (+) Transcript_34634:225-875(+)
MAQKTTWDDIFRLGKLPNTYRRGRISSIKGFCNAMGLGYLSAAVFRGSTRSTKGGGCGRGLFLPLHFHSVHGPGDAVGAGELARGGPEAPQARPRRAPKRRRELGRHRLAELIVGDPDDSEASRVAHEAAGDGQAARGPELIPPQVQLLEARVAREALPQGLGARRPQVVVRQEELAHGGVPLEHLRQKVGPAAAERGAAEVDGRELPAACGEGVA